MPSWRSLKIIPLADRSPGGLRWQLRRERIGAVLEKLSLGDQERQQLEVELLRAVLEADRDAAERTRAKREKRTVGWYLLLALNTVLIIMAMLPILVWIVFPRPFPWTTVIPVWTGVAGIFWLEWALRYPTALSKYARKLRT